MVYLKNSRNVYQERNPKSNPTKEKFYKKRWFKILLVFIIILAIAGGIFLGKASIILNKISKGGILSAIVHNIPGVSNELKGEKEGQINILLLGMRGEDLPGGGLLADSIELIIIKPAENKVAMISIPRDLYVTVPGTQDKQKINAVHAYGEQKGRGQGLEDMKTVVSEVTGIPIHYAASINFTGFKQLVNAVGGVDVTLDKPFEESMQFNEPHVCDSFWTVPTGEYQNKIKSYHTVWVNGVKKKVGVKVPMYPLCTAPAESLECGGNFKLPAGKQTLNGDQALCFARSRVTSSDFERAKRQQYMIQQVKNKMLSIGTLADFSKINGILNSLGDNVRADMQLWEMQKLYEVYKKIPDAQIYQRVLEDSEEGLLYAPTENTAGYILLPRGDNYDKIHDMVQNVFNLPAQKDAKAKDIK